MSERASSVFSATEAFEISSRAERSAPEQKSATSTGDHHHAHRTPIIRLAQRLLRPATRHRVECVFLFGTINRDARDRSVNFIQNWKFSCRSFESLKRIHSISAALKNSIECRVHFIGSLILHPMAAIGYAKLTIRCFDVSG